eukprot:2052127-Amphidinium_carterae.1
MRLQQWHPHRHHLSKAKQSRRLQEAPNVQWHCSLTSEPAKAGNDKGLLFKYRYKLGGLRRLVVQLVAAFSGCTPASWLQLPAAARLQSRDTCMLRCDTSHAAVQQAIKAVALTANCHLVLYMRRWSEGLLWKASGEKPNIFACVKKRDDNLGLTSERTSGTFPPKCAMRCTLAWMGSRFLLMRKELDTPLLHPTDRLPGSLFDFLRAFGLASR